MTAWNRAPFWCNDSLLSLFTRDRWARLTRIFLHDAFSCVRTKNEHARTQWRRRRNEFSPGRKKKSHFQGWARIDAFSAYAHEREREREKKRHVPDARSLDLCPEAIISRRSRKENLVPNQSDVVISNVPKISLGAYNFVDGIVIPLCQDFRSYQKELLLRSWLN